MLILFIHSSICGFMRLFSTLAIMNVAAKWKFKYDTAKKIKKTMKNLGKKQWMLTKSS